MARRPRYWVEPVWHRERSPELTVDVARVVGYRAACDDGWRGPVWGTWREALSDARERRRAQEEQAARA